MELYSLHAYDYTLPKELIAQLPVEPRDHSRLMIVKDSIYHDHFFNLPEYLEKDDVLVLNDSKVLKARLLGKKETGGKIEALILKELKDDRYECLIEGKNIKTYTKLIFSGYEAIVEEKKDNTYFLKFDHSINLELEASYKLPPYIKSEIKDPERYQTVYSKENGSLAAPTAGLHFTNELLEQLQRKQIKIVYITLHIGYSTFMPVRSENIRFHKMHEEYYSISPEVAKTINNRKGRVVAVGTTTVRALESNFKSTIIPGTFKTELFIYSGYKFKSEINMLITNFHIPRSSLLMLVTAYGGYERIMNAYRIAVAERYRFYSFGDAMLVYP